MAINSGMICIVSADVLRSRSLRKTQTSTEYMPCLPACRPSVVRLVYTSTCSLSLAAAGCAKESKQCCSLLFSHPLIFSTIYCVGYVSQHPASPADRRHNPRERIGDFSPWTVCVSRYDMFVCVGHGVVYGTGSSWESSGGKRRELSISLSL